MRKNEPLTRRLTVILTGGLIATGGLVTAAHTSAAAAPSNGDYTLVNGASGLCATVPGQSSGDGVQLVQNACSDAAGQVLTITASGAGHQIKAAHSGKCLGVRDASTSAGKAVQQETCTGAASQTWRLTESGADYRVVNANGGKCLNVKDNSTSSGGPAAAELVRLGGHQTVDAQSGRQRHPRPRSRPDRPAADKRHAVRRTRRQGLRVRHPGRSDHADLGHHPHRGGRHDLHARRHVPAVPDDHHRTGQQRHLQRPQEDLGIPGRDADPELLRPERELGQPGGSR
ncbi:RICIN domain-containing protein [Nonomuraea salmonea]|uniref:RICIN domain-containing protein n=1 Tax=Nonomuraea salmonea TaxID=46181 RepID=UPI003CD053DD